MSTLQQAPRIKRGKQGDTNAQFPMPNDQCLMPNAQ